MPATFSCPTANNSTPSPMPLAQGYARRLAERASQQLRVQEIRAQITSSGGRLPGIKAKLYPYQAEGVAFLAANGRALLADDMGLGKPCKLSPPPVGCTACAGEKGAGGLPCLPQAAVGAGNRKICWASGAGRAGSAVADGGAECSGGAGKLAHAPKSAEAGVWVYAEAVPNGWRDQEEAALVMRAVALAQAPELPASLLEQLLDDVRGFVGLVVA